MSCDLRYRPERLILLRFRQSKACSEVRKRLLLHLAANPAALDQANNGSLIWALACSSFL